MYRSRQAFAPGTQGKQIFTLSSRRSRLGIEAVHLLHQEPMRDRLTPQVPEKSPRYRSRRPYAPRTQGRPIYTLSSRISRLGIEAVELLHQEPKGDRFTP